MHGFFMWTMNTLIILRGCAGSVEYSLGHVSDTISHAAFLVFPVVVSIVRSNAVSQLQFYVGRLFPSDSCPRDYH